MAACSETEVQGETETEAAVGAETAGNTEPVEGVETEPEKLLPNLEPDLDYGGSEVRLMQHPQTDGDWTDWVSRELYAEDFTGEPINDAEKTDYHTHAEACGRTRCGKIKRYSKCVEKILEK